MKSKDKDGLLKEYTTEELLVERNVIVKKLVLANLTEEENNWLVGIIKAIEKELDSRNET